jgi:PST family polysaccharide transporter
VSADSPSDLNSGHASRTQGHCFNENIGSGLKANIAALYGVQGATYLLPLLMLPYLSRVLGPQGYGTIAFAQSLMAYAVALTDFGFNFTATRAVSIARDQPLELAQLFWSTIAAKSLLAAISAVALVPAIALVPALNGQWQVLAACGLSIIGSVALPQWYFLGLERMRAAAVAYICANIIVLAMIFILVRSPADLLLAAAILSSAQILAGIVCALAIRHVAPIAFYLPTFADVRHALGSSWHMFVSNVAGCVYLNGNTFILGLMAGDYAVAQYSLANSTVLTLSNLMTPVAQAAFPIASAAFRRSPRTAWHFVGRLLLFTLPVAAFISIALCIFSGWVVRILGGQGYANAVPVMRAMSILPFVLTASGMLAQVVMINLGMTRLLSRIYIGLGVLDLTVLPAMISRYQALGAALSLVLIELLGPLLMIGAIHLVRSSGACEAQPS